MNGFRLKTAFVALLLSVSCLAAEGYSFQVVRQGTGRQAVVFIPGFACSGEVWQETVEAIKDSCTCYVLTMPGFAGVAPEAYPSFEGWKQQIIRFIEEKHLEKPVLVGHSMGGGLALAVAADRSDLLKSVVVVDALPCLSALYNPGFQSQAEVDCTGIVQQLMAQDDAQFARQQRLSAANLTTDSLLCERLVQWGTTSDRRTYAQMYCDYSNTDMRPMLGRVKVPALVLLESSFQRMAPMVEEQFKELRTVRLEYATQGLHFIMRDDWDWFIRQFKGFLMYNSGE